MRNKSILILGASYYQVPAIICAKKLGLNTIVCSNNVFDPGIHFADFFFNISTDNINEILEISQKNKIDGIMTIASDFAMPTVAFISEKLDLPNYPLSSIQIISNKFRLKSYLSARNIPVPQTTKCLEINDAIHLYTTSKSKMIMKPLESSGSKGIFYIQTVNDIIDHFEFCKNQSFHEKGVILEEYIFGREIGVECFIQNGLIKVLCCTNKYKNQYFVPIGHSVPCQINNQLLIKVRDVVSKCVNLLNLVTGPVNFDIIISNDEPIIIDMGARLGGNCLPLLVEKYTGVNTIEATIKTVIGEKPILHEKLTNLTYGIKIIGVNKSGLLVNLKNKDEVVHKYPDNIVSINYDYHPGQYVEKFDQGKNRIGDIFIKGRDINQIENIFNELDDFLDIAIL